MPIDWTEITISVGVAIIGTLIQLTLMDLMYGKKPLLLQMLEDAF